jgi:leucyl-tRNA synthetase
MTRKVEEDTEKFSFNTAVSSFMIGINELTELDCHSMDLLTKLLIVISPYAPHLAEELWNALGNEGSVLDAPYPAIEEKYLVETTKEYPVAVNGKTRTTLNIDLSASQADVEAMVLADPMIVKWLEGKSPKKIIFVKGKMINLVV